MNSNIVIKIGGSLLFSENNKINLDRITGFCEIVKNKDKYDAIVIVCGGGLIARDFINAVRKFSENEALCDIIGIEVSRLNSRLLVSNFKDEAYPIIPKTIEELSLAQLSNKIIVMGGLQPGQSTTSVAIEVAEYIQAEKLIILTDVDGIYDKDPKIYKDAKLIENISVDELKELVLNSFGNKQAAAGEYRIFDAVSLQILKRSKLPIKIISGNNLDNFQQLWKGKKEVLGTLISP